MEREIVMLIAKSLETWDRASASPDSIPKPSYIQAARHVVETLESKGYELKSPAAA